MVESFAQGHLHRQPLVAMPLTETALLRRFAAPLPASSPWLSMTTSRGLREATRANGHTVKENALEYAPP